MGDEETFINYYNYFNLINNRDKSYFNDDVCLLTIALTYDNYAKQCQTNFNINPNRFTWSLFCPWHDFVIFITHR